MNDYIPKIILIGKPNVGKSTLFNTILGKKEAIVGEQVGLTRDYQDIICKIKDIKIQLIDTAGITVAKNKYSELQLKQIKTQVQKSDIILFLTDSSRNLTTEDDLCIEIIRKSGKNIILIENKSELKISNNLNNLSKLGFGTPLKITAKNKNCINLIHEALLNYIRPNLNSRDYKENKTKVSESKFSDIRVSIAGKPNTGKSTLLNLLNQSERAITGSECGTTRDSILTKLRYKNNNFTIIDTAGIRKKGKITDVTEKASSYYSRKEIRYANIVILVIDASSNVSNHELNIANYIIKEGRGLLIIFNKWDLVKDKNKIKDNILENIDRTFFDVKGVNVLFMSALNYVSREKVFASLINIKKIWSKKIGTSKLNSWLQKEYNQFDREKYTGSLKLRYVTQIKTRPPTFSLFFNNKNKVNNTVKRNITNRLRESFNLNGVPIRIVLKSKLNPYYKNKKK